MTYPLERANAHTVTMERPRGPRALANLWLDAHAIVEAGASLRRRPLVLGEAGPRGR